MSRALFMRFLVAASLAVTLIVVGVYVGLGYPGLRGSIGLPFVWAQGLGAALGFLPPMVAGSLALVVLWFLVTMLLWGAIELANQARRGDGERG